MNQPITLSAEKIWVVRVRCDSTVCYKESTSTWEVLPRRLQCEGMVFYSPLTRLREEIPSVYRGFEQWSQDMWVTPSPERLLQVHKDMRLGVELPNKGICFCDLSQEEVTANPWRVGQDSPPLSQEIWEFLPFAQAVQRVYRETDQAGQLRDVLEETLYRGR